MGIQIISVIGMVCLLVQYFDQAGATSYPMSKEQEEAIKLARCQLLTEERSLIPAKFNAIYDHIENVICKDPNSKYYDAENYLTSNLSEDEYLEIRIFRVGKDHYCSYILGLPRFWRKEDDINVSVDADKITTPEYLEFKEFCKDSTKTEADIIPLAQTLQKIYYHF